METKRGLYVLIFSIIILLSVSLVSAGFFDWFKRTVTGKAQQQLQNLSITVTGVQPAQITYVYMVPNIDPTELDYTTISFVVTMRDPDGVNDLNHTSVQANFSITDSFEIRENLTCAWITDNDLYSANYSCSIDMWYWDVNGTWDITVRGKDKGNGNWQYNDSETFVYNLLRAMILFPQELTWPAVSSGATNQTAVDDPTIINNTGNYNGLIDVAAIDLLGELDSSQAIYAENFAIGTSTGPTCPDECEECIGTQLQNYSVGVVTSITNTDSNPGNLSIGSGVGQEELYHCVTEVPTISSQTYSTLEGGSWTIIYPV